MASSNTLIGGKYTIDQCMQTAQKVVVEKTKEYRILDKNVENKIPKFSMDELTLGRVLGKGGFCVVSEISKITLLQNDTATNDNDATNTERIDDEHAIQNIIQDRSFMETHCLRGKDKDCRYAIKVLLPTCRNDEQMFINGVVDLAVEARFLAVIRHPSIIKMRAMAITDPFSTTQPYFLVLDRLYDILDTRISKWKKQKPKGVGKLMDRSGKKEKEFWIERITVAYDLASALQHIHELCVVYRDIKPENIGFDVRGDVKIFDFGLAKQFDPLHQNEDGLYLMTGDTGSPRYMAPEVFLNKPYNELCDIYSFSILLWQILQLETPYEGFTMNLITKKVVEGGARPKCDPKWPPSIIDLLLHGWNADISLRPSAREIVQKLGIEMGEAVYTNLNSHIVDGSKKSDQSLRNMNNHNPSNSKPVPRQEKNLDRSMRSYYDLKLNKK